MKRLITLIALLGFVGLMLTGCKPADTTTPTTTDTNVPPAAASTNQ